MDNPHPYNHHHHQLRDEMISNICGYCIVLKYFILHIWFLLHQIESQVWEKKEQKEMFNAFETTKH